MTSLQQTVKKPRLTVDPLPIPLLLAIKDRILVLGPHFLLPRHLSFPPVKVLHAAALFSKCGVYACDDAVDSPETFALPSFLGGGEAPWDFPGLIA